MGKLWAKMSRLVLRFTREGITIRAPLSFPLVGETFHDEQVSYDKIKSKVLNIRGATITPEIDDKNGLVALNFEVEEFKLAETPKTATPIDRVEITLTYSSPKYALIPLPKIHRRFFPGYNVPFYLEAFGKTYTVHVTSAPAGERPSAGDPDAGAYMKGRLRELFREHPELKLGMKVAIISIEPMRRYRLEVA